MYIEVSAEYPQFPFFIYFYLEASDIVQNAFGSETYEIVHNVLVLEANRNVQGVILLQMMYYCLRLLCGLRDIVH